MKSDPDKCISLIRDTGVKLILNSPSYLSLILSNVCPEIFTMSPQEIAGRIKREDPLYHGSDAAGLPSNMISLKKTTAEYGKKIFDVLHLVTLADGRSYFIHSEVQKFFLQLLNSPDESYFIWEYRFQRRRMRVPGSEKRTIRNSGQYRQYGSCRKLQVIFIIREG